MRKFNCFDCDRRISFKQVIAFLIMFSVPVASFAEAPVVDYSTPEIKDDAKSDSLLIQPEAEKSAAAKAGKDSSSTPAKNSQMAAPVIDNSSLPLDKRVGKLEQQINNINQANVQENIEKLQQQLQQLSGDLEIQQHNLKDLQDQVHSLYSDLDKRMEKSKSDTENPKVTFFSKSAQTDQGNTEADNTTNATKASAKSKPATKTVEASSSAQGMQLQDSSLKEQQLYQSAFDLLQSKKYDDSARRLKAYLNAYPDGIYAVNSHYWLGQIYFLQQKYSPSTSEFNTIISKYPESSKVPDAMLQIAFIHEKQGKHDQAQNEFRQVKKKFPKSAAAKLADQQLKKAINN